MIDFFQFTFFGWIEKFGQGDYVGGILLLFIAVLMVFFIFAVLALIYDIIDTSGEAASQRGTVVDTRYAAAYTTMIMSGKVMVPIHHPARWYATFSVPGGSEEVQIEQAIHTHLQKDDQMDVLVTTGRLSKAVRIVGLA